MFQFEFLKKSLPDNVNILSFEEWDATNSFLLRLEHILEKDEDPILSKDVEINLNVSNFENYVKIVFLVFMPFIELLISIKCNEEVWWKDRECEEENVIQTLSGQLGNIPSKLGEGELADEKLLLQKQDFIHCFFS